MSQGTLTSNRARSGTGSWLVLASAFLLSGLAIADRTIAWMIGRFPTSAALWELRFEYLRPIGVFHDIAVQHLGTIEVGAFNIAAALAAIVIGCGAISGIRLARALSCHVLLGAALVVAVHSIDPGEGIYATVGVPSSGYVLIGSVLAISAAILCLAAHAEYIGWNPASSRLARRAKDGVSRLGAELGSVAAGLFDQLMPAPNKSQAIFVRARRGIRTSSLR